MKLTVYTVHYEFLKADIIFLKSTKFRFVPANDDDGKLRLKLLINQTLRTNLRVLQKKMILMLFNNVVAFTKVEIQIHHCIFYIDYGIYFLDDWYMKN